MDKPRVALFALWPWQGSFQVVQREQRTHGLLPQIRWANCGCVLSHMPKHFEYPTPMVSDDLKAPKPINVQKFHGLENQSSSLFHIIPIHVGSFWGGVSPVRNGAFSRMELKHMFHALQVPLGPELNTSRPRRKPTGSWPGHVGHGGPKNHHDRFHGSGSFVERFRCRAMASCSSADMSRFETAFRTSQCPRKVGW